MDDDSISTAETCSVILFPFPALKANNGKISTQCENIFLLEARIIHWQCTYSIDNQLILQLFFYYLIWCILYYIKNIF